jgi:hypothetical protein
MGYVTDNDYYEVEQEEKPRRKRSWFREGLLLVYTCFKQFANW